MSGLHSGKVKGGRNEYYTTLDGPEDLGRLRFYKHYARLRTPPASERRFPRDWDREAAFVERLAVRLGREERLNLCCPVPQPNRHTFGLGEEYGHLTARHVLLHVLLQALEEAHLVEYARSDKHTGWYVRAVSWWTWPRVVEVARALDTQHRLERETAGQPLVLLFSSASFTRMLSDPSES